LKELPNLLNPFDLGRHSYRCKVTRDTPCHKTARSRLAQFSAASIMNTGGKGSLREGRIADDCSAGAAQGNSRPPKHGGTQLQTSRPNLLVGIAKKSPLNFLCGSGWFRRIERRGVGEEFVGSCLYQVHLDAVSSPTITGGSSEATMHI
jgi:hypothetical protein